MSGAIAENNTEPYVFVMSKRLTVEDWLKAGFQSLVEMGPQALKAEPLARKLGTTKGSFYWHFKDVPSFRAAMLALWRERAVHDIIAALDQIPDPKERLRALGQIVAQSAPESFGGARAEAAIRAWGLSDAQVAGAIQEVDAARIAYLEDMLPDCGLDANQALMLYGAYVGFDQLAAHGRPEAAKGLSTVIDMMLPP